MKSARESLADLITVASAEGFKGLHINCGDRTAISVKSPAKKKAALVTALADANLTLSSLCCSISFPGPEGMEDFKSDLAAHLELATELGAESITILGSTWVNNWDRRAFYIDAIAEGMAEVLCADPGKAKLLMQNHASACNAFDCIEFAQYVAHARFGLVFSSAYSHLAKDGYLGGILQANQHWLWGLSISDVNEEGKGVAPGEGVVDLKTTVKYQKSRRFRGWYIWDRSVCPADGAAAGFKAAIGAK
jgi:sugar phosphate isomerase/epimerase